MTRDEQIPAEEKIHSLFEPHAEWLYKGESNKRVGLGHTILVASNQWGFIVDHVVVEKQADVSLTIPLADRLLRRYGEGAIDKGFTRKRIKRCWVCIYLRYIMPKTCPRENGKGQEEPVGTG